ncbi:hypothetical protein ACFY1U_33510 [Streptomyces sp. NPDC001351]|uniref:hypothetical protein n=1 Tax=Streptomyces sp. NPDC001351 TaxID=3364564 RepID=UPI003677E727
MQRQSSIASSGDVVSTAATTCLDVMGNSWAYGVRARIWPCTGAANQDWWLR